LFLGKAFEFKNEYPSETSHEKAHDFDIFAWGEEEVG
jgi:hypothetical protein